MTVKSNPPPLTGDPVVGYPSNHPPSPLGAPPPSRPQDYNFNPHLQQPEPQKADCAAQAKFVSSMIPFLLLLFLLFPALTIGVLFAFLPDSPEFRADSLSVPNFNISNNNLVAADWDLRFTVRNPNRKLAINYEHIYAEILCDSAPLAQTSVRPFYQGPMEETSSVAKFAADGTFVDDWIVERVNREKPYIEFNVRFTAWIS